MADEANVSPTYPAQASACRQGSFLMIKGHACKIVAMSTSKTGKHGHAKCKFTAIDIFDNTKHEMVETSTHNVEIPNVRRDEYNCIDFDADEGFMTLMADNGDTREDLKAPPEGTEVGDALRTFMADVGECKVTILVAIGREQAIDVKKPDE